jgi:hypothetical protein
VYALIGGLAQCRERLEKEIAEAAPPNSRVKVTSPANAIERRFSVWIGAASSRKRLSRSSGIGLYVELVTHPKEQHACHYATEELITSCERT